MKERSMNKKGLILLISTGILLVFGFLYFFTDLISADVENNQSINTAKVVTPSADLTPYQVQVGIIKADAIKISEEVLGFTWNQEKRQWEGSERVWANTPSGGTWITNPDKGKTWAELHPAGDTDKDSNQKAKEDLHSVLNNIVAEANETMANPAKLSGLIIADKKLDSYFKNDFSTITMPNTQNSAYGLHRIARQYLVEVAMGRGEKGVTKDAFTSDQLIALDKRIDLVESFVADGYFYTHPAAYVNIKSSDIISTANALDGRRAELIKMTPEAIKAEFVKNTPALKDVPAIALAQAIYLTKSVERTAYIEFLSLPSGSPASKKYLTYNDKNTEALVDAYRTLYDLLSNDPALLALATTNSTAIVDQNPIPKPQIVAQTPQTLADLQAQKAELEKQLAAAEAAKSTDQIAKLKADIKLVEASIVAAQGTTVAQNTNTTTQGTTTDQTSTPVVASNPINNTPTGDLRLSPKSLLFLTKYSKEIAEGFKDGTCSQSCAYFIASTLKPGSTEDQRILANFIVQQKTFTQDSLKDANGVINPALLAQAIEDTYKKSDILQTSFRESLSIDPLSGNVQYVTTVRKKVDCTETAEKAGDYCFEGIGYAKFDPFSQKFGLMLPYEFAGQKITLYSDPNSGYAYVDLEKSLKVVTDAAGKPVLDSAGNVKYIQAPYIQLGSGKNAFQLTSIQVSLDGTFGGSFNAFGKAFSYNPNSKAIEMPIRVSNFLGTGKAFNFTLDSRGLITGQMNLSKVYKVALDENGKPKLGADGKTPEQQEVSSLGISFDTTGNMSANYSVTNQHGVPMGGITIGANGSLGGTVNVGKLVGLDSIFVGFDKNGISGVSLPVGSIAGVGVSFSVGKDGGLSIGGFVPLGPIPIPLSIGQNARGGFKLAGPGFTIKLGGDDKRPLAPPTPKMVEGTKNYDMSEVYYAHSLKKALKTIRIYQVPPMKLTPEQQKARSAKIFATYKEMLGRNPSTTEFMNWYFWSGHQPYALIGNRTAEQMLDLMANVMKDTLQGKWYASVQKQYRFIDGKEYACIKASKPSGTYSNVTKEMTTSSYFKTQECSKPNDIMTSDPFSSGAVNNTTTKSPEQVNVSQFYVAAQKAVTSEIAAAVVPATATTTGQ